MLGKDLTPGDLTERRGLIVSVRYDSDDRFWEGPHVWFICRQDSYHGRVGTALDLDEDYEILHERDSEGYKQILAQMREELIESIRHKKADINQVETYHPWF